MIGSGSGRDSGVMVNTIASEQEGFVLCGVYMFLLFMHRLVSGHSSFHRPKTCLYWQVWQYDTYPGTSQDLTSGNISLFFDYDLEATLNINKDSHQYSKIHFIK